MRQDNHIMTKTPFDPKLLKDRSIYPTSVQENVRNRDCDSQRHVNNAVYATYFEIGRGAARRVATKNHSVLPEGAGSVVVQQIINYHVSIPHPAVIDIAAGIMRIGRSSFTYGLGIFWKDQCAASGEVTIAMIDRATGKSMAIPDYYRAQLETIMLRVPAHG